MQHRHQSTRERGAAVRVAQARFRGHLLPALSRHLVVAARLTQAAQPFLESSLQKLDVTALRDINVLGPTCEEASRELENVLEMGAELAAYLQQPGPLEGGYLDAIFGRQR